MALTSTRLRAGIIKRLHVNAHVIKANAKHGTHEPALTVKTSDRNTKAHEVIIYGQDGLEAARLVYRPESPLACGARCWVETKSAVVAVVSDAS